MQIAVILNAFVFIDTTDVFLHISLQSKEKYATIKELAFISDAKQVTATIPNFKCTWRKKRWCSVNFEIIIVGVLAYLLNL